MQTLSWKTLVTWKSWSLWTESARKSKQTGHKPFPCAFVCLIHLMVHSLAVAGWKVRGVWECLEDCGLRGATTRSLNSREENRMEKWSLYPLTVLQWYKWKIHVHPNCRHRFMVWNGMPWWPNRHGWSSHPLPRLPWGAQAACKSLSCTCSIISMLQSHGCTKDYRKTLSRKRCSCFCFMTSRAVWEKQHLQLTKCTWRCAFQKTLSNLCNHIPWWLMCLCYRCFLPLPASWKTQAFAWSWSSFPVSPVGPAFPWPPTTALLKHFWVVTKSGESIFFQDCLVV